MPRCEMHGGHIPRLPTAITTRGRFTALIGYEYTTNGGNNLHRNVIFRGDASEANQTLPFSQYESKNPEDLWRHLAGFEERTGAEVIAIPHNGNLSNGRMFDAMKRREVYGTTGSRMVVRFFGGYGFAEEDATVRLPADIGYAKGVPMGGDLAQPKDGEAPSFLVAALRDPLSGNLDRIQIIKGWIDADGNGHEKVYDVAWSDGREPDADSKIGDVGNTVDVVRATWTNTIGAPELIGVWQDPDFDPAEQAFYYARVIEIPTPRWTTFEAVRFNVEMPPNVPMITTERAYTAPIWYTPR